ncbi:MAG: hypothetical protein IJQ83_01165 [Bacteroidales bacterium]|nr:hypothetical protein [Bacteroidales bacterium]
MVIRIIVEGGAYPTNNTHSATDLTLDGSEVLREELKKFFTAVLGIADISIIVSYQAGYKNAAKVFIAKPEENYLYTDLDDIPERRADWFTHLAEVGIVIPDERKPDVFFWIQEMEAWFLKQPQSIERWATDRNIKIKRAIVEDPLISGKDIEHLQHKPSYVMKVIFQRDLENTRKGKNGKIQKLEYGKLRHAPRIIPYLIPQDLMANDAELRAFVKRVKEQV